MSGKKRYPVRIPQFAVGIRAQESRTGAGRSWWTREWTHHLEAMGLRGRLGHGKSYALSGQVVSLALAGTHVADLWREDDGFVPTYRRTPRRLSATLPNGHLAERWRLGSFPILCAS